jgi:hypothetical protein
MYKKLYIYIFFYSLCINSLFAFSIEAGEDKNVTLGDIATIEATVSVDVNTAELVWKINNETYAEGKTFYFYPTEIGTYSIHLFYQGNEEDNLTVNAIDNLDTETLISKFTVKNKCIQVRILSGKGHSASYIYIKVEDQIEQLLYTANIAFNGKFPIINSPEIIELQDGGYSVFWLVYSQMADESLRMSRFNSNGIMVVNNKFLNTFNVAGSNVTIKQLSNQNYVVGNCATHGNSVRVRIYDYTSGARLHQFYPKIGYPCNYSHKSYIMPISNNTFVFSLDSKLWHFDNQGNEIPFN